MNGPTQGLPPLPKGATLDSAGSLPPLPKGAKLDATPAAPAVPPSPRLASTFSGTDLVHSFAPDFSQAHPHVANAAGALLDVLQGGGREALAQAVRLARYVSPKGGAELQKAIGDYTTPIDAPGEGTGRFALDAMEFAGAPESEGNLALRAAQGGLKGAALTALQGGSPAAGAVLGSAGESIAAGLQKVAPGLAEGAIGIRRAERAYGKTPGEAILNDTSGVTPQTVSATARLEANSLTQRVNKMAANYKGTVNLDAVRQSILDAIAATPRNATDKINALQAVYDNLDKFGSDVSAADALEAKRGLRTQFSSFKREPQFDSDEASRAAKAAASRIDAALDTALGDGFATANQRLSSLIDVIDRAQSTARAASTASSVAHRVGAHTGALTASAAGGYAGYEHGGIPGAIGGAVAGAVIPELIASPEARLAAARGLNAAPAAQRAVQPAAQAAISAFTRKPGYMRDPKTGKLVRIQPQ